MCGFGWCLGNGGRGAQTRPVPEVGFDVGGPPGGGGGGAGGGGAPPKLKPKPGIGIFVLMLVARLRGPKNENGLTITKFGF